MPSRRVALASIPALLAARPSGAEARRPLVVVELFTSQSCSSCPPADALLGELARTQAALAVLPLSFHVTYWDRLGWRDPFSLPEATARQRRYAAWLGSDSIYTPQAVVQGLSHHVGSDRAAVLGAVERARAAAARGPVVGVERDGEGLMLTADPGAGSGRFWLVGYDLRHVTPVRGGENSGRTLTHTQVVRSLREVGGWEGTAARLPIAPPAAGERVAVLLQGPDGAILAAATLPAA